MEEKVFISGKTNEMLSLKKGKPYLCMTNRKHIGTKSHKILFVHVFH